MLAERFLVNMFLKMSCFPGLGKIFLPKFFFWGGFFFHGMYFDHNPNFREYFLEIKA